MIVTPATELPCIFVVLFAIGDGVSLCFIMFSCKCKSEIRKYNTLWFYFVLVTQVDSKPFEMVNVALK